MKNTLSSLALITFVCLAPEAFAQAERSVTAQTPSPVRPGARLHDGFYLRLGTGFGSYGDSVRKHGADEATDVTGIATAFELAIGGAIRPGLILGAGIWTSDVLASNRTVQGATPPDEILADRASFTLIGPFFDYYFDARHGLHLQGAIGFASLDGFRPNGDGYERGVGHSGGAALVGIGYDWWASEEWSLGILGRLAVGMTTGKDDAGVRWYHVVDAAPSVLFSATFN